MPEAVTYPDFEKNSGTSRRTAKAGPRPFTR